jgi:hypothetical protein
MLLSRKRGSTSSFTLKLFSISVVLILIPDNFFAYPVFGTKSYGRSIGLPHRVPATPYLHAYQQPQPHAQTRYGRGIPSGPSYYPAEPIANYPYAQDYPESEFYYVQEPGSFSAYPYYPTGSNTNGNMKYPVYQSVVPYYYGDGRHGYYGYDEGSYPIYDLQEETEQEEEREQREEALPIGQETWFEGGAASERHPKADSMEDANAAFLQNLIMSQMYNDANGGHVLRHPSYTGSSYSVPDDETQDTSMYDIGKSQISGDYQNTDEELENEDVRELKSLVKKNQSGELNDHLGKIPVSWFPAMTTKFNNHEQPWYTHSSVVENTQRPEYYEPIWFATDSGPWFENSWSSGMSYKRNAEPLYQSIRSYNKKQESSEYGPWIPKGTINFSDRKGNDITASGTKVAKMYQEQRKSAAAQNVKTTNPIRYATTTPRPTTFAATQPPVEATSSSAADFDPRRGQKEVALLRPATPVRHPFTPNGMDKILARSRPSARHASSVYGTIKQILNMEQELQKVRTVRC